MQQLRAAEDLTTSRGKEILFKYFRGGQIKLIKINSEPLEVVCISIAIFVEVSISNGRQCVYQLPGQVDLARRARSSSWPPCDPPQLPQLPQALSVLSVLLYFQLNGLYGEHYRGCGRIRSMGGPAEWNYQLQLLSEICRLGFGTRAAIQ